MSHRDRDSRTAAGTNAQAVLAAMKDLLTGFPETDLRFRRDCRWSGRGLVMAALLWAWSSKTTLGERFEQSRRLVRRLGRGCAPAQTSYQAFLKLLVRWTGKLRERLVRTFQNRMQQEFPELFQIAGYLVLAADGSKLQLARTRSNEARYAPAKARRRKGRPAKRRAKSQRARQQQARNKKGDSPQMSLTALYHVGWRLPWDWRLGPSDASEREHLQSMLPHLPPETLITADCGFVGYEFWSALLASGRQFVIRVGGNVRLLKKLGHVRESQGIVYLWPDKAAKRGQPPLVLRLVVVQGERQPWFLVTSVCDPSRLSDRQVADIYRRRWGIELFFRHFKQTFGRAKLRSHKAEHALCEAEWSLLGLWAMLLHAQLQRRSRAEPRPLGVARVLRAFGQALDEMNCAADEGESLTERLIAAKPPHIRTASRTERQRAMQLKGRQTRKGLTA